MVDIHSHIVWDVDDGPQTVEESLAMLEAAVEAGTTEIVATSHANARYAWQPDVIASRIAELVRRSGGKPKIHSGCELHLSFDNIDALLERPAAYTINRKQYLLAECPDFHIGRHTDAIFRRLMEANLIPVIAHPERNPALRADLQKLERWVDMGCLLQITALSLTGGFGGSAKSASMRLLERGLAHVVASDAHDPVHRSPRLAEAYGIVRSRYDEDTAEVLFTDNPRAIVEGIRLPGGRQIGWQPPRRWYEFWKIQ